MDMVLREADGTDPALACSVIHCVSQWIPATVNAAGEEKDSTFGLFQFTGQQANQAGFTGKYSELIDSEVNVRLGVQILRAALNQANNRAEAALLTFLGRSRGHLVPNILAIYSQYQRLIEERLCTK